MLQEFQIMISFLMIDQYKIINLILKCLNPQVHIEQFRGEQGTYEQMNRDTAFNDVKELINANWFCSSTLFKRQLTTKQEVEQHILNLYQVFFRINIFSNNSLIIVRPRFIYRLNQRWWSVPLKMIWQYGNVYNLNDTLFLQMITHLDLFLKNHLLEESSINSKSTLQQIYKMLLMHVWLLQKQIFWKSLNNSEMEKVAQEFRSLK
ncbi:unnamed protein product (macronuclear) [Paramecium tetraurelia]|uniref:Uncharacterized protein n=1 Tax=Paramecium tetraurelia TaxID=5888 RepID=A0E6A8_PARTE|nr:uncharacterized protein GSPATT00003690001 [Paramecium tetraurelia]CAK90825.1 unnamed protein product [Paramecium tetraurelia]|eukprot:XP_001458222.1 hypothetical protein (macronuclear) [Paramecium tetraurelia strain d4-2]